MEEKIKRKKRIEIRLSIEEYNYLQNLVSSSGLSREAYLRCIIKGIIPRGKPTENYLEVIKQLRAIGNNLNQISIVANKTNNIDIIRYKKEVKSLKLEIAEIKKIASKPFEVVKHGNNKNMGC